ncbi:MAG: phosphotyrosine protein phosphatase [Candidatus Muproteobacteria bacterium RIFCSPHIGHO2_02_FULL_60_13]|uniref:Phosphotyrosine protein phosphatase n=1 Tax=Candidatus Muproteobacteria bacterium RIFCSPLOWO2_01_FULL_60_18 TaxID=1817768 RepID=A0A1F6U3E6_9PROT|nr:MAG: phosphotyrosine protein phosphatase [Candidatus Muproteobacteria bacterium RIFCSPLOWO2_01_FULL_60_18]OGI53493.1 MAG: phosphotyrosine protein phosphatase [Candidatus Muproteobacteria bacterium RIFCSPHIGHO2_01_60_12]OGI55459.1 MAG: phosphotyrosine protein phosphatase [Candidatus Muproteobacteria bacterium RIFCSPHIGHO2_02_FULL_60_13]
MIKVLFVCLGNICRSPTAEGVFRKLVRDMKLEDQFEIDSAGTHAYHVGEPPDERAQAACALRGIDISRLSGRKAVAGDMEIFDYILAMDRENYENLLEICPTGFESRIRLFMVFAPNRPEGEVPDPYFGGAGGFDRVLDMIEDAARGLLEDIRRTRRL